MCGCPLIWQPFHCCWAWKPFSFMQVTFILGIFHHCGSVTWQSLLRSHLNCSTVWGFIHACAVWKMLLKSPGRPKPEPEPCCHTPLGSRHGCSGDSSSSQQGPEGMSNLLSKAVGRQTKHRAVGVTSPSNGATRTNPSGTRVQGKLFMTFAQ